MIWILKGIVVLCDVDMGFKGILVWIIVDIVKFN